MSDYGIQVKGTSPILKRPVRPLSSQSPHLSVYKEGGRIGFKEGMGAGKRRKFGPKLPGRPKSPGRPKLGPEAPRDPHKKTPKGGPPSPQPKSPGPPKGGSRPGRSKGHSPKKVEEDWAAEGGRIGFKAGGDSRWIQKATKSIKQRGTEGKCTPITKPECTGKAKVLAKTFKKMAKKRKNA